MTAVLREKWPVLGRCAHAAEWLQIWSDLGRAPRTIDAYGRGLAEYLQVCERDGIDPLTANRSQVAAFVRELISRPSRRGANVLALGLRRRSGQRDAAAAAGGGAAVLRLPGRGGRARVQPGRSWPIHPGPALWRWTVPLAGCADGQAALDSQRGRVVAAAGGVSFRADPQPADAGAGLRPALRREELCSLRTDDFDPAYARCGCAPRRPKLGRGGWCPRTRPRRGRCCRSICGIGPGSAVLGEHCFCPSLDATTVNR
jgi:integrase/recombinase XerD